MALRFDEQTGSAAPIDTLIADDSGRLVIQDSALLFSGSYTRSGPDLFIAREGAETIRVEGYFLNSAPADLFDAAGAVMRGDVVARLAGPLAPGQYAQVGSDVGPGPIGQVETIEGTSSVQRVDGTVQTLEVGMKIFQNDVIATETDATVSVTFVDGTIFTLASASRMVIDELIYDPAGTENSGVFNLIQGSFVFIAGQVAKTGGMEVNTPSSTMGIRGTTVVVKISSDNGVSTSEVTLTTDPDGGQGRVELFDLSGSLITTITDINSKWIVSPVSTNTRQLDRTSLDDLQDGVLIAAAFAAFRAANSRVDAGDTFVTLGDALDRGSRDGTGPERPTDLGVDSIDEPDGIDAPLTVPVAPERGTSGSFDEGSLQSNPNPTITVAGLEDRTASGVISGTVVFSGSDASGLVFSLAAAPRNGSAFIDPSGAFRFVPDLNFNGQDSFTFAATSLRGEVTNGTVVISVMPVNDAPQANDQAFTLLEDGILAATASGFDIDGDTLAFSISAGPANGDVVLLQDGSFAYRPDADFAGVDTFTVRMTDPSSAFAESVVSLTVLPVADAPRVISTPESAAGRLVEGGGAATVTGALVALDPDGNGAPVWSGSGPGIYGTFSITAAGVWTYALDPAAAEVLVRDEVVTETFSVAATNASGDITTLVVTVSITGTNAVPVIDLATSNIGGRVLEGAELPVAEGVLTVRDPDLGATVTWSGVSSAVLGSFEIDAVGNWTYSLDNTLADGLDEGETRVETFRVTATDEFGASVIQNVDVTVTGSNDAPIVRPGIVFETLRNGVLDGTLVATDADENGALTFAATRSDLPNGTLVVNPDGTFTYTPDPGFLGTETFEFTVTDVDGAVTTAQALVEVESALDDGGLFRVSVDITSGATPRAAAGAVEINIEAISETSVNLVIALDGSGSIGRPNWEIMLDAVDTALSELQQQFAGTSTTVDVKFITFSTVARGFGPFDLYDADLSATIAALPYDGGATNWNLALDAAADFLFSQDPTDSNFMLFITDGRPSNGAWVSSLERLQNPTDAFSLNIQAFSFGDRAVLDPLQRLEAANYPEGQEPAAGPDRAEFLTSPEQLADALRGSPIFDPRLLSLEVKLTADNGAERLLADETDERLFVEGTNFELPLATIENIALLLGESNRISVRAKFDIDRDENTAEIDVFSSEIIGKATAAQDIAGLAAADLMFGSDFADRISGGAGNDVILGYDGADVIDGGAGADTILAGGGDDLLLVNEFAGSVGEKLDGGAGRDTLKLGAVGDINALLASLDLKDIEAIDVTNGQADVLRLELADVVDLSSTADSSLEALLSAALPESATIYGDVGDRLVLEHDPAGSVQRLAGGPVSDGSGNSLSVYQFLDGGGNVLATLGVDADVAVETVPV